MREPIDKKEKAVVIIFVSNSEGKNQVEKSGRRYDEVLCRPAQELLTYITLIATGTLSTAETLDSPMRSEGYENREFSATRAHARRSQPNYQ